MRITKAVLDAQVENLNYYTNRAEGERYYIGYECGYANLFLESGSGRETISYGNTKKELSEQLTTLVRVLWAEERRKREEC